MRCPDCNKFVGLEFEDPTVEGQEISADDAGVRVEIEVHLARNCSECGQLLKEATLTLEAEVEAADLPGWDKLEDTERGEVELEVDDPEPIEEGGGRYAKSYFGASVTYRVVRDGTTLYEGTADDKVPASGMDECV